MDFKYLFLACSCAVLVSCGGSSTPNEPLAEVVDKDAAVNEVNEAAEIGDAVGVTAEALDPDESDTVSYSLSDNAGGLFAIDAGTGVVTVAAKLDFETATSHTISVLATSSDETTSNADFTIDVLDNLPPVISLSYPVEGIYNGDTIGAYGSVSDPEGDAISLQVTSSIGSIDADLGDGDSWRADHISINAAIETLIVSAVDASGEVATPIEVELRNELVLFQSWGMDLSVGDNVAYVIDDQKLYAIDVTNGSKMLISGGGQGVGTNFSGPQGVAVDEVNSQILVIDWSSDRLFSVDPGSGDRTVVSATGIGTGSFSAPSAVAVDTTNNLAYVGDGTALVKVDLATGDKTIISADNSIGAGDYLYPIRDIDLDIDNNTAYVSSSFTIRGNVSDYIYSINLTSGDRVKISDNVAGSGPAILSIQGIVHDKANARVVVSDHGNVALYAVDIATGARTILSNKDTGSGDNFHRPYTLAFNSGTNKIYALDSIEDGIFEIDATSGDRGIAATSSKGGGEHFLGMEDVVLDSANNRMIALDTWRPTRFTYSGSVVAIDLDTSERTTLSNGTIGAGITLVQPRHLILDSANNRVIVSDQGQRAIIAVDLTTGERVELSGPSVGVGDALASPAGIDYDPANNRVMYVDWGFHANGSLLGVIDLATGNRTIISDTVTGVGSDLLTPLDVIFDADNNRSFVIDSSVDAVFSVDMTTGDRTILSKNPVGTGLNFNYTAKFDWDKESQKLYVMDVNSVRLFEVDIATGNRLVLSDGTTGQGEKFLSPQSVVFDSELERLFTTDFYHGALFVVDPQTGDRIIKSK